MIDEQTQRALAFTAARARPTGANPWPERVTLTVLADHRIASRKLTDVWLALARASDDPTVDMPHVLLNPASPCWRERDAGWTPPPDRIDPALLCDVCGRAQHPEITGDHQYVAAGRARASRLPPDDANAIVAELRDRAHPEPPHQGDSPAPQEH